MRSACQLSVGSTSEPRAAEQERPRRVRRRRRSRPARSRSESTPCCGRSTPSASLATPGRMASRMSTSSTPARSRPTGSTSKQASSMSGVQCDRVDDTFFCAVNSRARPKKATSTDEAVRTLARLPTTMSSAKSTLSASALTRRKTATTTQEISTSAREATHRSRPPTETTSESPCCRDLCFSASRYGALCVITRAAGATAVASKAQRTAGAHTTATTTCAAVAASPTASTRRLSVATGTSGCAKRGWCRARESGWNAVYSKSPPRFYTAPHTHHALAPPPFSMYTRATDHST